MTHDAQKHIDNAAKLLTKGDGLYRQAGEEILLAREAGATWTEIGKALDRSTTWCKDVARWAKTPAKAGLPEVVPWTRGSHGTTAEIQAGAKKLLAEAPMEQVEQIISGLPKDRQTAIRAAAGDEYAKARQAEDERVRNLTPAQRKEIEAAKERIAQGPRAAVASFTALGVVGHLDQATEDLSQMIADQQVTPESIYRIEQAHERFATELEVARAMAGLEERSEA